MSSDLHRTAVDSASADKPRRPLSARRLAANRRNAQKSTGPRTRRGKHRSRMNAVTHGVFCGNLVLPGESDSVFHAFRHGLLAQLGPQNLVELLLCDRLVGAAWRLRRLQAAESLIHLAQSRNLRELERSAAHPNTAHPDTTDPDTTDWEASAPDPFEHDSSEQTASDQQASEPATSERHTSPTDDSAESAPDIGEAESATPNPQSAIPTPPPLHASIVLASLLNDRDSVAIDRCFRHETRLDLTIHRCLRQLRNLRRRTQEPDEADLTQSPFVPDDAYTDGEADTQKKDVKVLKRTQRQGG